MRFFTLSTVVCFLAIIFLPSVDRVMNLALDKTANTEKRKLANMPDFQLDSITSFPRNYEAYYDDHFSFRNFLIKTHSYWSLWAYNISEVSDVLIGEDNWLYYVSKSQGDSMADYTGLICLSVNQLETIRVNLERRKRMLDSLGIAFIMVIPPDKHTIYPEFLPDNIRRRGPCPGRLNQVVDYLKKNSSFQVLDLRKILAEEKKTSSFLLYQQTDSHWSDYGGFIAYQAMMRALGKQPLQKTDFEWQELDSDGGDLAGELTMANRLREKRKIFFTTPFEAQLTRHLDNYGPPINDVYERVYNKNQNLPKLLFLHDSFGESLIKFVPHHFRESVMFASPRISFEVLEKEKPDIVIMEIVERYVDRLDMTDN